MRNIELTFKEFLIAVLCQWKAILAVGAVVALLAGAYGYYAFIQAEGPVQEAYSSALTAHEDTLASKINQIRHQMEIREAAKDYVNKSLLMQIDPYNKQVATLYISVEVEPETQYLDLSSQAPLGIIDLRESMAKNIVGRYLILAKNARFSDVLGEQQAAQFGDTYLHEIVQVASTETDGVFTITAFGTDSFDAKAAANAMFTYLTEKKPLVTESVTMHALRILDESTIVITDQELAGTQTTQRSKVSDASNKIETLFKDVNKLRANKPSAPSLTSTVIRNVTLGFMLSLVLGIALVSLLHLTKFPLRYTRQIQEQLGLLFLGGVKHGRRGILFTRWNQTLTGENLLKGEAEALALIAANLEEAASSARRVLVTGTLPEQTLRDFSEKLAKELKTEGLTLIPSPYIDQNAQTVRNLAGADAVILVERLHTSRLKTALEEKERIEMAGKPVLGYVLC